MPLTRPQVVESARTALQEHPRTPEAAIQVAYDGGIIALTGTVTQERVSKVAESIMRQQEGFIEVINDLIVEQAWEVQGAPVQRPPNYNI